MKDLPVVNVLYAFDKEYGTNILLEHSNTIFMGENMDDSLADTIQSEDNDIWVDLCHKSLYLDE